MDYVDENKGIKGQEKKQSNAMMRKKGDRKRSRKKTRQERKRTKRKEYRRISMRIMGAKMRKYMENKEKFKKKVLDEE